MIKQKLTITITKMISITRISLLYGRPSRAHFRTSSLFEVNCSSERTVDDNKLARNSRARANCY